MDTTFKVICNEKSGNDKTGCMPVSMTHRGSCPPACGMRGACYASGGNMAIHWRRMDEGAGHYWSDFLRLVKNFNVTIWRHNSAGDLPGRNNRLSRGQCLELARANVSGDRNRGGYTYTHYPVLGDSCVARHNRGVIAEMNSLGFRVNLSADSIEQADALKALGIAPVVVVVPSDTTRGFKTPAGNTVGICPAFFHDTTCSKCRLCQKNRSVIVALLAHGVKKNTADAIVRS
ncbi:MAG: hypothetical protein WC551_08825 [Patescibacteria group bacterium]